MKNSTGQNSSVALFSVSEYQAFPWYKKIYFTFISYYMSIRYGIPKPLEVTEVKRPDMKMSSGDLILNSLKTHEWEVAFPYDKLYSAIVKRNNICISLALINDKRYIIKGIENYARKNEKNVILPEDTKIQDVCNDLIYAKIRAIKESQSNSIENQLFGDDA